MAGMCVVLFPGFGYGADKPLLYYARIAAEAAGNHVEAIDYKHFQREEGLSVSEQAMRSLGDAVADTLEAIQPLMFRYGQFLFISKSFGTLVAGMTGEILKSNELFTGNLRQIYLTPLPESYERYMKGRDCIAVSGTADPFFTGETFGRMEEDAAIEFHRIEGGNHSLNINGDVQQSIAALKTVVDIYRRVME